MDEPQSFFAFEHKLLNEHHDQYVAFTRLILSLATGTFSLLIVFGGRVIADSDVTDLARWSYPILLVSILSGVFVQHRIMMNPLWHIESAKKIAAAREKEGDSGPVELRRKPSKLERFVYRIQVLSFLAAFVVLAAFMLKLRAT